MLKIARIDKYI